MIRPVILASGSHGNAVKYGDILIDCGIPSKNLPKEIMGCYITHRHGDHWNISAIKQLAEDGIKIFIHKTNKRFFNKQLAKEFTGEYITWVNDNFSFVDDFTFYNFKLEKVKHDVTNFAVKLTISTPFNTTKIFHATDAANLDNISAENYHIYSIETNYSEKRIRVLIREDFKKTGFSRFERVLKSHLSKEQAIEFLNKNKGDKFERFIRLHKSSKSL